MVTGKAAGPNGLSNRILRELPCELSSPFCCLFNPSIRTRTFPISYKEANVCPVPKKAICLLYQTTDQCPCLIPKAKFSKELLSNTCLIIFKIIIYFPLYSLALCRETPPFTNLLFFITLSVRRLILARRFGLFSVTPEKPLTVYGILVFCINFGQLVLQEISKS